MDPCKFCLFLLSGPNSGSSLGQSAAGRRRRIMVARGMAKPSQAGRMLHGGEGRTEGHLSQHLVNWIGDMSFWPCSTAGCPLLSLVFRQSSREGTFLLGIESGGKRKGGWRGRCSLCFFPSQYFFFNATYPTRTQTFSVSFTTPPIFEWKARRQEAGWSKTDLFQILPCNEVMLGG